MSVGIHLEGVGVRLGGRDVLRGVDLEVPAGGWCCLLGPNGAGKTTLLRALSGTVRHSGRVTVGGRDAGGGEHGAGGHGRRDLARTVAVVPQSPEVPVGMRVFEYVLLGRTPHQGLRFSASLEDRRRTLAVLQRLDLEALAARDVATLSGGERQRAVLARALVADAPVLLCDEPTAALDLGRQIGTLELLAELQAERGLTLLTTLHDLTVAGQFGDAVAVLADGVVVAHGAPSAVLTPPTIAAHWGVDVATEVDGEGRVGVTVRRRRERREAGRGGGAAEVVARGEGFEPPAA